MLFLILLKSEENIRLSTLTWVYIRNFVSHIYKLGDTLKKRNCYMTDKTINSGPDAQNGFALQRNTAIFLLLDNYFNKFQNKK